MTLPRRSAANTLNDYARTDDPFSKVGERTVTDRGDQRRAFRLRPVFPDPLARTGVRQWLACFGTERWTAVASRRHPTTPRDPETLRKNPLGIYVHGLNWSKDLIAGEYK